jgi:hypothetical protein
MASAKHYRVIAPYGRYCGLPASIPPFIFPGAFGFWKDGVIEKKALRCRALLLFFWLVLVLL